MELMENTFSLVVCIISFLQVFHTIIFLEFDTSIPYSFIVFMFLFLSSLGLIFGSRIMLSEGEFLEHSSTTGKGRAQRRFADHNFQHHLHFLDILSLALCLVVAGCVSPFSGIFFLFTVRSRFFQQQINFGEGLIAFSLDNL